MSPDDEKLCAEAAALLAFRDRFAPPRQEFCRIDGGPYPLYHDDVEAFFRLAGAPYWSDYGYSPREASLFLADPQACAQADLAQLRSALTCCVRAERFGDGAWNGLLCQGVIQRLLDRLAELVAAVRADPS